MTQRYPFEEQGLGFRDIPPRSSMHEEDEGSNDSKVMNVGMTEGQDTKQLQRVGNA